MPASAYDKLLTYLQTTYPGYWEWLRGREGDAPLSKVRGILQDIAGHAGTWSMAKMQSQLEGQITGLKSYTTFSTAPGEEPPPEDIPPGEEGSFPTLPEPGVPAPPLAYDETADVRAMLRQFLIDNELPTTLMGFIETSLAQKQPFSQIVASLRETPEYKAAYPENDLRQQLGFDWRPEAEIRAYRSEVRRLTESYLGSTVSNTEIATLFSHDVSLAEWERKIQTFQDFERWGPTVRAVFENELGYTITDDRAFAFMAPFIATPELDHAYEMALYRARPAVLGIGVRPDEEAEMLRRYGISVEQAFRGYQGIVQELPRTERMAAIESEINRNVEQFPTGTELFAGTPFATLFRAVQLQDPDAIAALQAQLSREVARFQAGGGPTSAGTGLLSAEERAAL